MEMGKKDTLSITVATVAKRIKHLSKTRIFYIRNTTDKIELTG